MGHSIQHYKFDENEDRNKIEMVADEDAISEGDYGAGLNSVIRYIDELYEDEEEAIKAIEKHDNGWYDQLAVKFYEYSPVKETKAIENLRARVMKYKEELNEYKEKSSIKNRKTKFVGCDSCGSKLNKDYISKFGHNHHLWNCCPLCKNDLSSQTIKNAIENKLAKINETENKLNQSIKTNDKKGKKKIMWLVKTEFHV